MAVKTQLAGTTTEGFQDVVDTINSDLTSMTSVQAVIGSIQQMVIKPVITSASSFSVNENVAFSSTATASKSVSWAKGGADADLVTLNTATGAWSVGAQSFETKTSVAFTLTAMDNYGNVSQTQSVVLTIVNQNDTSPAAFSFASVTGVTAGSTQTSPSITIAGLGASDSVSASVSGAAPSLLSKNGGSFVAGPVTVVNADTLRVQHTASSSGSTSVATTLAAGTTTATFTSTTAASAAPSITPEAAATRHWVFGTDFPSYADLKAGEVMTPKSTAPVLSSGYLTTQGQNAGLLSQQADAVTCTLAAVVRVAAGINDALLIGNIGQSPTAGFGLDNMGGSLYYNVRNLGQVNTN